MCRIIFGWRTVYATAAFCLSMTFSAIDLYAQKGGYFLLEYTADGIRYNTFSIDSGNGRGLMRVRYKIGRTSYLVEQLTKITSDSALDKNSLSGLILTGQNPHFIGKAAPWAYFSDVILLKWDKETKLLKPDSVYSKMKSHLSMAKIDKYEMIEKNSDKLEKVLADFEIKNPVSKEPPRNRKPFSNSTMHLVLLTNNGDPQMRSQFSNNHVRIRDFFADIAGLLEVDKFNVIPIMSGDFSKAGAESKLNFQAKKDDIIIFYYSGHGYCLSYPFPDTLSHESWPGMILTNSLQPALRSQNTLKIKDVHDLLSAKADRVLTFAECCNSRDEDLTKIVQRPTAPALTASGLSLDYRHVSDLFLQPIKLLVTTSRPGEFTAYHDEIDKASNEQIGYGFFCRNFVEVFSENASKADAPPLTWKGILRAAASKTAEDVCKKSLEQHTMFKDF